MPAPGSLKLADAVPMPGRMSRAPRILATGCVSAVLGAAGWLTLGGPPGPAPATARSAASPLPGATTPAATGGPASAAALPPLPARMRPRAVEPTAGARAESPGGATGTAGGVAASPEAPAPIRPASRAARAPAASTAIAQTAMRATAGADGIAVAPAAAPAAVHRIIAAGNVIARTPYKWGGGHGRWLDDGYDCSGSVSFALAAAGLLDGPLNSTGLKSWGQAGAGDWVTVWANDGHVYMEVAGIRFDTSGARRTGSRWQTELRRGGGFVARHPSGL